MQVPYPLTKDQEGAIPLGMVITEFHYLILYDTMLQAVSRLNGTVVFYEKFLRVRTVDCFVSCAFLELHYLTETCSRRDSRLARSRPLHKIQ